MEPARERDFPERPTEVLHPNVATSAAIFSALSAQELPGPNAADSPDSSLVTCGECAISEERPCVSAMFQCHLCKRVLQKSV